MGVASSARMLQLYPSSSSAAHSLNGLRRDTAVRAQASPQSSPDQGELEEDAAREIMDEIAREDAQAAEQSRGKQVVQDLFPQGEAPRLSPRQQRARQAKLTGRPLRSARAARQPSKRTLDLLGGSVLATSEGMPDHQAEARSDLLRGHCAPAALCTSSVALPYADFFPHDCCIYSSTGSTLRECLACSASGTPEEVSACADARRQPDLSSMGTLARAQDTRAQRALPSVPRLEPLANPQVRDLNKIIRSEILVNLRCLVTRA